MKNYALPAVYVEFGDGTKATFVLDTPVPLSEDQCQAYALHYNGNTKVSFGFRKSKPLRYAKPKKDKIKKKPKKTRRR